MAHSSAPDFLLLHALRVKAFAGPTEIADLTAQPVGEVEHQLEQAHRAGWAEQRRESGRRISGWALSPAGRARHQVLLGLELEAAGARGVLGGAFAEFSELDERFQQVCSQWQLRPAGAHHAPNRHDDPTYDRSVIAALRQVDDRAQRLCAGFSAVLGRMSPYGRRLSAALARVQNGDRDSFTRPLTGSYHDVWTELHHDLVVTMSGTGIPVNA